MSRFQQDSAASADPALTPTVDGPDRPVTTDLADQEIRRGESIGRLVVLDRIGAGGMGVVYGAYDPELDRKLAVKLLRDEQSDPVRRERLLREAQAMARLSHPNVCVVHDVGTWQGQVYIAMEFVDGVTLGRWVKEESPDWPAIVETFIEAGKGLAAAHEAGLVHRDFKPENVVVGKGRVRVMDFGLARQTGTEDEAKPDVSALGALTAEVATGDRLSTPLTREGAVTGTPAYMSPEQHFGFKVDEAADQFSFCVSLYEALFGERPFAGTSVLEIAEAIAQQDVRAAPKGTEVPTSLRAVVLRGLDRDPKQRHPSMGALLGALAWEVAPSPKRNTATYASFAVVLGGVGLAGYVLASDRPCDGVASRVDASWNTSARTAGREAFVATDLGYAEQAWARTEERLAQYAQQWAAMRRDACESTHVRQEQSSELLDLRMHCLDRRLAEFDALLDVLTAEPGPAAVEQAPVLASRLRPIDRCADVEALRAAVPPPENPDTRDVVEAVRAELRRAEPLRRLQRVDDALEVVQQAGAGLQALGYVPIEAEVRLALGLSLDAAGDYEGAAEALETALVQSLEVGHDEVAVEAAIELVHVVGFRLTRHEQGLRWGRQAQALVARTGGAWDRDAELKRFLGAIYEDAARFGEATESYERAIAILEQQPEAGALRLVETRSGLGSVAQSQGDFDVARSHFERALAEAEAALGKDHPLLRPHLNELGTVLDDLGDYEGAEAAYRRALALGEGSLGPDHPAVATLCSNLGVTLTNLGRLEEALRYHHRARDIWERSVGAEHAHAASAYNNIATIHMKRREFERAGENLDRAVEVWTAVYGPRHPRVANGLVNLGQLLRLQKKFAGSRRVLERARRIYEEANGPRHPSLVINLLLLSEVTAAQGQTRDALAFGRLAADLSAGAEPADAASAYYGLAEVLWYAGHPAEAYAYALSARTIWAAAGERFAARVADVDDWMNEDWDALREATKSEAPGAAPSPR